MFIDFGLEMLLRTYVFSFFLSPSELLSSEACEWVSEKPKFINFLFSLSLLNAFFSSSKAKWMKISSYETLLSDDVSLITSYLLTDYSYPGHSGVAQLPHYIRFSFITPSPPRHHFLTSGALSHYAEHKKQARSNDRQRLRDFNDRWQTETLPLVQVVV